MGARSGRSRVLLVVILLVPIVFVGFQLGRLVWANSHFHAAERALAERDFPRAREHLARCLRVWPSDPDTLLLACQAARRDGDFTAAGRLLDACVAAKVPPEAIDLERNLFHFQKGNLAGAELYVRFCATSPSEPQTPLILEALIVGCLQAMNLPLASQCLDLWDKQQSGPADQLQGHVWRGDVAIRTGGYERAMTSYRKALDLDPQNATVRQRLGELLTRYAPREAITHLKWLLHRQPKDRSARLYLARCMRTLGEHNEAMALLDSLLAEVPNDFMALLERAQVELDLGRTQKAEETLRRAEALDPGNRALNLALARCLMLAGKETEAKHYQEKLAQIDAELERRVSQIRRPN